MYAIRSYYAEFFKRPNTVKYKDIYRKPQKHYAVIFSDSGKVDYRNILENGGYIYDRDYTVFKSIGSNLWL